MKQFVVDAVDKSLGELIDAVAERSIFIAKTTTKELVCFLLYILVKESDIEENVYLSKHNKKQVIKDFATEQDTSKMKTAAQQMVKCLAAHLAIATCKEMLKVTMKGNLTKAMPQVPAGPIDTLVRENLDFGVSIIEKVAVEEASREMDKILEIHFRDRREGKSWDPTEKSDFVRTLPANHRPKTGLTSKHLNVYKEFSKMSTTSLPEQHKAVEKLTTVLKAIESETDKHYREKNPPEDHVLSLTHPNFTKGTQSTHHENIRKSLCCIPQLIKEDTAVAFAKYTFQRVYQLGEDISVHQKNKDQHGLHVAMLLNEICLFILQSVREKNSEKITAELTSLFLASPMKWFVHFIFLKTVRKTIIFIHYI